MMTQEDSASEVFLGPTGSETEEFYTYQREHPGLEKAEYLEWFQQKFNKEIELRRRRSDQPSDLEFMVIKKRSKYRERIGEESAELVAHSEKHPEKTYRQLADWFQQKFQKEIDITAISRAIKRNRQESENGHMPHPDQAPPPPKRGRRSLGSVGPSPPEHTQHPNAQSHAMIQHHHPQQQIQQQPVLGLGPSTGSTSTFAVDRKPYPNTHTPNITPNHTPKNRSARMATPEESHGQLHRSPGNHQLNHQQQPPPHASAAPHHPQNSQPLYPPIRAHPSPEQTPRQLGWATVNSGHGNATYDPRQPPRGPPNTQQAPQGPLPPSHVLRKQSLTGPVHQTPPPPPHQLPPALQPGGSQPMQRRGTLPELPPAHLPGGPQHHPPYDSVATHVKKCVHNARQLQSQLNGELHHLEQEFFALAEDKARRESQWLEERQALIMERDQLRIDIERNRQWAHDLERGNLELQEYPAKYQRLLQDYERNAKELHHLHRENTSLQSRKRDHESEIFVARKALRRNGLDRYGSPTQGSGDRKSSKELDDWVCTMFDADAKQAENTTEFLNNIENSGFKDFATQLEKFRTYLAGVQEEREQRQQEWVTVIGRVGPRESSDTRMHDDGEDADDEGEGSKQSSKEPSPRASVSRTGSPSTTSTSPLPTIENEDKKVKIADMIDAI